MSKSILIIGESGSGKTTSLSTLPSEETFYIDCDGKGLSWKGWRNQYNKENKNYKKETKIPKIMTILTGISEKCPEIKYVVIDTLNTLMIDDEMERIKEKGYDKWIDLASSIYYLIKTLNDLRDDLTVICLGHSQTDTDELNGSFTKMKTSGRKLDKICVESFFTTVLLCKSKEGRHFFETKSNNSTAKTPRGAFDDKTEIDNDIMIVLKELEEF